MLSNATIGSKVALYHFGKIEEKATIEGQTDCYLKLSNGQRVRKELGYYFESYNKSKRIDVEPWSEETEAKYQTQLEARQAASVLSAQKAKLDDYIQHMKIGYFKQLSSDQISKILAVCQKQIGDISTPRTR